MALSRKRRALNERLRARAAGISMEEVREPEEAGYQKPKAFRQRLKAIKDRWKAAMAARAGCCERGC
jgi:hypothetical protein